MLDDYQKKRDFTKTPEPSEREPRSREGPLSFVVQEHSARRHHFDFRLELDGVLKSWAVTKGPSYNPEEKRLAVMVEDHPLDYASFEGSIPSGQYGAGQVIVWDRGVYTPEKKGQLFFHDRNKAAELMREALEQGKISLTLRGEKLKGSWTLVRMKGKGENWLLIKHRDEFPGPEIDILEQKASVISGLTIEDLKSGKVPPAETSTVLKPENLSGAMPAAMPAKLLPMLASTASDPFFHDDWLFEPKLDGYRTLAFLDRGRIRLHSRRGIDVSGHYPSVTEGLKRQPVSQAILDGEIIAFDSEGRLCFQCLQGYLKTIGGRRLEAPEYPSALIYYVFDVLYLDGFDLRQAPLEQRKELLKRIVENSEVRLVEGFLKDGEAVYEAAVENGLEGIMAKQRGSVYEPGKRSRYWLKIKSVASDDFVVGGYTRGRGARSSTFGSLLLGYYDERQNLHYAGNVGTGFDNQMLGSLKKIFDALKTDKSPFFKEIDKGMEDITWVRPEIVIEVKFSEWTRDRRLRAPVFLRVREDKPPESVRISIFEKGYGVAHEKKYKPGVRHNDSNKPKDVLEQLSLSRSELILEVEGSRIPLSNLDKHIFPEIENRKALTKRDLITYLAGVAPYILPHLRNRPLSLNRFPDGIYGEHFFQKHYDPLPDYVQTVLIATSDQPEKTYVLCNNFPTLIWLGQIASLEIHAWFSRIVADEDLDVEEGKNGDYCTRFPDFIIFDIDPYIYSGREGRGEEPELNREAFKKACEAALELKKILEKLSLPAFIKTSGKTGLHVFVPVQRRLDYSATRSAAENISRFLVQNNPSWLTTEWAVEKRRGKIFLDYNQNVRGKTLASVYSPRPVPEASVSVPLRWNELDSIYPSDFTILNVPERLKQKGDLWENILEEKADLEKTLSDFEVSHD